MAIIVMVAMVLSLVAIVMWIFFRLVYLSFSLISETVYSFICSDLFSGSSYASAYYVYLWAEVLDAGTSTVLLHTNASYLDCTSSHAPQMHHLNYSSEC